MVESGIGAQLASAWKDTALLFLGAVADNAMHCGEADRESFRTHVRESIEALQKAEESAQILMNAGGAVQAIKHYTGQSQKQVDALRAGWRDSVQMFLEHLEKTHPDPGSAPFLATLRAAVEQAVTDGQFGATRESAQAALEELTKHDREKRSESLQLTGKLQDRITVLETNNTILIPTPPPAVDATTGLPKRAEAEAAIEAAIESHPAGSTRHYVAVFFLHRMQLTNARFGEAIGNQVLLFCCQNIASALARNNDSMFRWGGPAFVAVLERQESEAAVNGEIQRLLSTPFSRFFETSSRSVYLPVKVTGEVIPLEETNLPEVVDRVERFLLKSSGAGV